MVGGERHCGGNAAAAAIGLELTNLGFGNAGVEGRVCVVGAVSPEEVGKRSTLFIAGRSWSGQRRPGVGEWESWCGSWMKRPGKGLG